MCHKAGIKKGQSGKFREIQKVCCYVETVAHLKFSIRQRDQKAGKVVKALTGFTIMGIAKGKGTATTPGYAAYRSLDVDNYVMIWDNLVTEDISQFNPTYVWRD